MLKINALHKSYGSKKVLQNIDLSFQKGTVTGIVGQNGAGKTTLFKCIAGLEDYDGEIAYDKGLLRNVMGFLATNPYFLSRITGMEYLRLMSNARNIKIGDIKSRNIFELPLNEYAETYSTGMKKKLALTAILLQENEVFILDEPFNGVDIQSNIVINAILEKLKALDKIVILSSHIFSTLSDNCDELHHLQAGKIVRSVGKGDFHQVEDAMKLAVVGNKVDVLDLK